MTNKQIDAFEPVGLSSTIAECCGCDCVTELDDMMLCTECASKLDRDMIRIRDWERSMTAWTTPSSKKESLRDKIIEKYGASLELISLEESTTNEVKRYRHKKRNR